MLKLQFYWFMLAVSWTPLGAQESKEPSGFYFRYSEDRCETPDSRRGACIHIRQCEPLLQILRNYRHDPEAVSFLRQSVCAYEGLDPIVCCPDDNGKYVEPTLPTMSSGYRLPTLSDNCGLNNFTLNKKVVNGEPANLGAYPWMAALGYRSRRTPEKPQWLCGGALITARHVITAAHCIHNHENTLFQVRLGELDLERDDDGAKPVDVPIEKIIKHEEYNPSKYTNDLGLIKLSYDVPLTFASIWPICLPLEPELRNKDYERQNPFLAGWGTTSFMGPSASHLQELQIPVVGNAQCKEAYERFKSQVIDQRVLCAGYARGGKDACQGDSGGPLMFPTFPPGQDNIRYYLIGVVSYGYKCAEPGYPGIYSRVTEFIPWIESHLND